MANSARAVSETMAGPILKWAGGKTQLLSSILPKLPDRIRTYYEPFIGGGAVFFALANQRRFKDAVISDQNEALVELYTVVRDDVEDLIEALDVHADYATDSDYFYHVRATDTRDLSVVERAARLIFLNKTCFNGLYRVNRKGLFNVPFGKYKNPRVLNAPLLRASSEALRGVTIVHGDFETVAQHARPGDAVYLDPPYVPLSQTSSFTAYAKDPFGDAAHRRLARLYREGCRRGVTMVMSNSDCSYTRLLYRDFHVQTVQATRAINSVAAKRGRVNEVLVVGLKSKKIAVPLPRDSALDAAAGFLKRRAGGSSKAVNSL